MNRQTQNFVQENNRLAFFPLYVFFYTYGVDFNFNPLLCCVHYAEDVWADLFSE